MPPPDRPLRVGRWPPRRRSRRVKEAYHGRASGRVRSFALYGDTTGETDEYGLPVRLPWAQDYRGSALVAYGHVPTPTLEWVNNTLCLNTGCVFGGSLSGLRYPERETVSVPAERVWYEPAKPLAAPLAQRQPDELRINDVQGKRIVEARHRGKITIRAENAAGALELMSRFALAPDQLWYLPPTMSPVRTSDRPGLLEHPEDAFAEYAAWSVPEVVCEEKHMGSRCVIHVHADGQGAMWSRTGRAMLDPAQTGTLLSALASAIGRAGLWDDLDTDRVLLDAEILPWSLKAKGLLRQQYAPVATAARLALPVAVEALERAAARGVDVGELLQRTRRRETNAAAFAQVYRRYTWPTTDDAGGIEIAPFQVLATSRATFEERPHSWHLELADRLADAAGGLVRRTRRLVVDTGSADSCAAGARWWTELTAAGVEGMVVKPAANLTTNAKGLVQPGLKVRGPEYLRLIYGPDYDLPHNLERLRDRKLSHKRALALNEYALGLEALARHVGGEPLWRVHEAVSRSSRWSRRRSTHGCDGVDAGRIRTHGLLSAPWRPARLPHRGVGPAPRRARPPRGRPEARDPRPARLRVPRAGGRRPPRASSRPSDEASRRSGAGWPGESAPWPGGSGTAPVTWIPRCAATGPAWP